MRRNSWRDWITGKLSSRRGGAKRRKRRSLEMARHAEWLQTRAMLSSVSFDSGSYQLDISLTGSDDVAVEVVNDQVEVSINGTPNGPTPNTFEVFSINVTGGDGPNLIDLSSLHAADFNYLLMSTSIRGGDGDDTIYGSGVMDDIHGERDNDWIDGGSGSDNIWGDNGIDPLQYGNDTLNGGADSDCLAGGDGDDILWSGSEAADDGFGLDGGCGVDTLDGIEETSNECGGEEQTDDDTPDVLTGTFTVENADQLVVNEKGTTASFTVVLDSAPSSSVVLNVSSNDSSESALSGATVTFSPTNWDTPQTVTVTGQDDSDWDGNVEHELTISVDDANSDDAFDAAESQTVSVITEDDEVKQISLNGKQDDIVGTPSLPSGTTFAISLGDHDELFTTLGGMIVLDTNLLKHEKDSDGNVTAHHAVVPTQTTYDLELILESAGMIVGTRTVKIEILPVVGLTGGTHLLEGGDTFAITFVRKAVDLSTSFETAYEVVWDSASPDDLISIVPDTLANSLAAANPKITFAAGESTAVIAVAAISDGNSITVDPTPVEELTVRVIVGDGYEPVSAPWYFLDEYETEYAFATAQKEITYSILQGVTLFAGLNSNPYRDDDGNDIHHNDVDQGLRADCYCMAVMAALAHDDQDTLKSIVRELNNDPEGDFEVVFTGASWSKKYFATEILKLGAAGATLSGDFDTQWRTEIWVQLFEVALLDFQASESDSGLPDGLWDGSVFSLWNILTGGQAPTWAPSDLDESGIATLPGWLIQHNSNPIVVNTVKSHNSFPKDVRHETGPYNARFKGNQLNGKHSYAFMGLDIHTNSAGVNIIVAKLYNPWGVIDSTPGAANVNHENVIWVAFSDLTAEFFTSAHALK